MSDPISRLQLAEQEVDRTFGDCYAAAPPDVVTAVVQSAATDWAAMRIAVAIERVAEALLVEEEEASDIVQPRELLRVRP